MENLRVSAIMTDSQESEIELKAEALELPDPIEMGADKAILSLDNLGIS